MQPFTALLPDWVPAEELLSLLLVLGICAVIGATVGTRIGRGARDWLERSVFERIPGYGVIRSLTHQMAGRSSESTWRAALVEIEDALVPGFIIEEFEDGRYTVFVPSIPTPFAGAVYVLAPQRVHPVDVPFTDALRVISSWGSGAKNLVAAMERRSPSRRASATAADAPPIAVPAQFRCHDSRQRSRRGLRILRTIGLTRQVRRCQMRFDLRATKALRVGAAGLILQSSAARSK